MAYEYSTLYPHGMGILSDLMPDTDDKTRKTVSGTVTPELRARILAFAEAAASVEGLHVSTPSAAVARLLETADMLGWLDDPLEFRKVYLAVLSKASKPKK